MPILLPSFPRTRIATLGALVATALLGLSACAQLPSSAPLAQPHDETHYATQRAFAAGESAWPIDAWWTRYGDAQLDALVAEALRASPDMALASARLRQAESNALIVGAAMQPQVSANASATSQRQSYNYLVPQAQLPQGWNDYGQAAINFNWEIDFWGKNRAALAAATSALAAQRAESAQAQLLLTTSLVSTYAELARLYAAQDTAEKAVDVRSRTAELFAERYRHGLETIGSVRQADARRASAQADLLQIGEQIGIVRNRLAALAGAGPDRGLAIERPRVALDRDFGLPPQLALDLLGRRPDIVAARWQAQAQARRIDQKEAEFYPNVNLAAFIGVQALGLDRLHDQGSTFGSVGPAISLPIFTGGRLRAELAGSRAAYDAAVASYDATVTHALQEVADAAVSLKSLGGQLAKTAESVDAAGDAHRVARNRYEGGLANYVDVLTAEDALLASRRVLSDLQSRAFTLDVALTRALGGGYHAEAN